MIEDDLPRNRLTANGQVMVEGDPISHGGNPARICLHDPRPIEAVSAEIEMSSVGTSTASFHDFCSQT